MICTMCGKEIKFSDRLDGFGIRIPFNSRHAQFCSDCGIKLTTISKFLKLEFTSDRNELYTIRAYRELILNKHAVTLSLITEDWLKHEYEEVIKKANEIYNIYENYEDFLHTALDVIKESYNSLPYKQVNHGFSTFAVDDRKLYYMKYGRPIIENSELFSIKTVRNRCETVKELTENVLSVDSLIDTIELDDILYYQEKGEINYSAKVSGGGSKGVSYGGAVLGGIIFGPAGAVVGAMRGNKTEEITSEIVKYDDRYLLIRCRSQDGKIGEIKAPHIYIDIFNYLIPEKDYMHVQLNSFERRNERPVQVQNNTIPVEELKKLKELLDIGIISQEEFEMKKKQMLGI